MSKNELIINNGMLAPTLHNQDNLQVRASTTGLKYAKRQMLCIHFSFFENYQNSTDNVYLLFSFILN